MNTEHEYDFSTSTLKRLILERDDLLRIKYVENSNFHNKLVGELVKSRVLLLLIKKYDQVTCMLSCNLKEESIINFRIRLLMLRQFIRRLCNQFNPPLRFRVQDDESGHISDCNICLRSLLTIAESYDNIIPDPDGTNHQINIEDFSTIKSEMIKIISDGV